MKSVHLEQYLLGKRIENVAPRTIDTYDNKITRALTWMQKPADEVEQADILAYLGHLQRAKRSPSYINGVYRTLNAFYLWLTAHEIENRNPMGTLKAPKIPPFEKGFLTENQFRQLLYVSSMHTFAGWRNTAWLWLLWSTGSRFEELANLKVEDLDFKRGRIHVIGKGSKPRYVPFTKDAQKAMADYLIRRPEELPQLWLTEERKPMKHPGLSIATRRIYERAQIKVKDLHHVFRRSWAWRQLKNGASTKVVALVGGWEGTAMLDRYVKAMTSEDVLATNQWV